ncbi:MAG: hypothetical protein ACM3JH_01340 [Acidithiobacillales bacterium]
MASLLLWWGATPAYDRLLAAAAEPVLRFLERPRVTRLYADKRLIVVERSDFPSTSERPAVPAGNLTFNVILLVTLAASGRRLLTDRGLTRLAAALGILGIVHVAAVVVAVKSVYAEQLGEWSAAVYGPVSRIFWPGAFHFYRFVGVFAVPFLLWWLLLRDEEPGERPRPREPRSSRRPKR